MRHRNSASKDDVAVAVSRRRRGKQQPPTPIVQINANAEVASFRGADLGLALNELDFPRAFESPPDSTNDSRATASACLDSNNASRGFPRSPDDLQPSARPEQVFVQTTTAPPAGGVTEQTHNRRQRRHRSRSRM
jgi:hypothetical protein